MWLLVSMMCFQTGSTDARCLRDVDGPYPKPMECRERIPPQTEFAISLAKQMGATIIFVSVSCQTGTDS